MRIYEDPEEVIHAVARTAAAEPPLVRSLLRDLHHVIDRAVSSDFMVLMGPWWFRRPGNPVLPAIVERFSDDDWRSPNGIKVAPAGEFAAYIGLATEDVELNPVAFGTHIYHYLASYRNDADDWTQLCSIVDAWRDECSRPEARYRVSTAGREAQFEFWLIENFSVLDGYQVELVDQQPILHNRRRPDLICRFTEDGDVGKRNDLLVIENKTTPVGMAALRQLEEYVNLVEQAHRGSTVHGLLIADGTTYQLKENLTDAGFDYLSLSEIGYREHLYRTQGLERPEPEPDPVADLTVQTPTRPPEGIPD